MNFTKTLYKYYFIARFHFKSQLKYNSGNITFLLANIIYFGTSLLVWTYFGNFLGSDSRVISYIWFVEFFEMLTSCWAIQNTAYQISRGSIANQLLYPGHFYWREMANFFGRGVLGYSWMATIPSVLLLTLIWNQFYFPTNFWNILTLFLIFPISFATKFSIQFIFSCLTFWTIRSDGNAQLYYALNALLNGSAIPLFLLPFWVAYQPFAFNGHFPAMIFTEQVSGFNLIVLLIFALLTWLMLYLIALFTFKLGMKKFESVGL
jgi:ABC-type uncharacterized transport system permease subunit